MKPLSLLLGVLALFTMGPTLGDAQPAVDIGAVDQLILTEMAAQQVPGLALAITRGDQVIYLKGYGSAREGQPVTPQTQFFIASVSKSFTALAVMQLVEAGRIDLDAPVQRYLPEFMLADPAVAQRITVRQLLNQVSGLADPGFPAMLLPQPATPEERTAGMSGASPAAEPGAEYHYFDVNYQILARVVEVAGGQSFSAYLQNHIFEPLGMSNTVSALTSSEGLAQVGNLAQGHLLVFGVPVASAEESGYLAGSGGVISTAEDMAHYLAMQASSGRYQGVQILSPAGINTPHTPPADIDSDYAMGWLAMQEGGTRTLEHNGILSTFYSEVVLLPETGHGIVLLYNIHSLSQDLVGFPRVKQQLIALLTGGQPTAGGWSVGMVEAVLGLLTLVSVALAGHSLLQLPQWAKRARTTPLWRLIPGIVWSFVPAALVLAMPAMVLATGGRAFGYITLFRSMVGVMTWLGVWGLLGAINGTERIVVLAMQASRRLPSKPGG